MTNTVKPDTTNWLDRDKKVLEELNRALEKSPEDPLVKQIHETLLVVGEKRAGGNIYGAGENIMTLAAGYTALAEKGLVRPLDDVVAGTSQPGKEGNLSARKK